MSLAEYIASVLPLTMGGTTDGPACIPQYRMEYFTAPDRDDVLNRIVNTTISAYDIQYLTDPIHKYDARG